MSGGSYDYMCWKDASDFLSSGTLMDNLDRMINSLAELGYAEDAAKESVRVRAEIRRAQVRIDGLLEHIQPVWHAIEWWDDGDWGEDQVKRVLAEWRGEVDE